MLNIKRRFIIVLSIIFYQFDSYATYPMGIDIDETIVKPCLTYSKAIYDIRSEADNIITGRDSGVLGKIWFSDNNIFIVFKGSSTGSDWVRNLQCQLDDGIHRGFNLIVNSAIEQVSRLISSMEDRGRSIIFTGHSLGGAIATLMAYKIAESNPAFTAEENRIKVLAFCSPKLCNRSFATRVNQLLGECNVLCFGDDCDLVPHQSFASSEFTRPGLFLGISSRVYETIDILLGDAENMTQRLFSVAESIVLSTHKIPFPDCILSAIAREKARRVAIESKISSHRASSMSQEGSDDCRSTRSPCSTTRKVPSIEEFEGTIRSVQSKIDELPENLRRSLDSDVPRIVLLGNTGAGKSTILDLLLGREVKPVEVDEEWKLTTPDKVDQGSHTGRNIESMQIGDDTVYSNKSTKEPAVATSDGSINYFDMPGFEDIGGEAPELLNAYFYRRLFSSPCDDTKVLFVINFDDLKPNFAPHH